MDITVYQEQCVPSQVGRLCAILAFVQQPVLMVAAVLLVILVLLKVAVCHQVL